MSAIPVSAVQNAALPLVYREITDPVPGRFRVASKFTGQRVHFVGIGGSGMSGLARMLIDCGAIVTGSDSSINAQTIALSKLGARISRSQHGELLSRDMDLVVRTAAVKDDHIEMRAAAAMGIRSIKYAQLLGEVMAERLGVAVAGTHGKSTTTAMTAFALVECGLDPSFVVGGTVPQIGGLGCRSGAGDAFIAEACEYDRSFHNLAPSVALITNIEEDHLDCYRDIYDIIESFRKFARLVPDDGIVIANGRDTNVAKVIKDLTCQVQSVSLGSDTVWSTSPRGIVNGCYQGQVKYRGKEVAALRLSVAGEHNLLNATMALAAACACGANIERAAMALSAFTGVDRRMTHLGHYAGANVVDDYGHHPTEVRTTLKALRERYMPDRLICVFQPHQHSRTRHLLEDFASSFTSADQVIMPDIYFVRDSEEERRSVCTMDLVNMITQRGQSAIHIPAFDQIVSHLQREVREGDLVVTMGAGNVNEIGIDLVSLA
jgi:UDP-N-acetylmuramate--alanine ligase